jgi:hypothetical protein
MGNGYVLWVICDYNTALIGAFFIEMVGTAIGLGLAILYAEVFTQPYVAIFAALYNILLSAWCLLGIYRAKTLRQSVYLVPFLFAKIVLAVLFPLAMYDYGRPGYLLLVCIAFVIFEGLLVAIAVGAHWQYRRYDPSRRFHGEHQPLHHGEHLLMPQDEYQPLQPIKKPLL